MTSCLSSNSNFFFLIFAVQTALRKRHLLRCLFLRCASFLSCLFYFTLRSFNVLFLLVLDIPDDLFGKNRRLDFTSFMFLILLLYNTALILLLSTFGRPDNFFLLNMYRLYAVFPLRCEICEI